MYTSPSGEGSANRSAEHCSINIGAQTDENLLMCRLAESSALLALAQLTDARMEEDMSRNSWPYARPSSVASTLNLEERIDHLPPLLGHLLRAVFLRPSDPYDRVAMVNEAAHHGEQRRTRGFDEDAILHEYYLLRQLLWEEIREAFGAVGGEIIIARVDVELSKAMAASVRGFHRDALEAQGRWPTATDEQLRALLGESRFSGPVRRLAE
jgi:hypothetical protein